MHRDMLIELEGQWCYAETEKEFARFSMIRLSARADVYRQRVLSASQRKINVMKQVDHGETAQDRALLLDAECVFAARSFVELSKQATIFQNRFHKAAILVDSLTSQRKELYGTVDKAMDAGHFAEEVPLGKSHSSGLGI